MAEGAAECGGDTSGEDGKQLRIKNEELRMKNEELRMKNEE
jgi:hypothetical protein